MQTHRKRPRDDSGRRCVYRPREKSALVWKSEHSLALPFLGIGMKTDLFQSAATAEFSKFAGILNIALS